MSGILSSSFWAFQTSIVGAAAIISLVTTILIAWCVPLRCGRGWCLCLLLQIDAFLDDYPNALARAIAFENKLTSDVFAVTPQSTEYADILALSVRQAFGNIELTSGFDGNSHNSTDIMAFMRGELRILVGP